MPEISIIVPVYNVERYLRKCVDSILAQTFKNFELILIDDGSTDKSGTICDVYKKKDSRIVVIHKKNGGLSSARNTGIDIARGNYLGFIDSDDYIDADMFEVLYDLIIKYHADMSLCRLYDCHDTGEIYGKTDCTRQIFVLSPEETVKMVLDGKSTSVTAVNKLYKRELFRTLRYPIGKTTEDAYLIVDLLSLCKTCVLTTEAKYYYIHRPKSITSLPLSEKSLDVIEAYRHVQTMVEKNFPNVLNSAHTRYLWAHLLLIDRMILENSKTKDLFLSLKRIIRDNIVFILFQSMFSLKKKLSILILLIPFIGNHLYELLLKSLK